jgi:hypothetical protein
MRVARALRLLAGPAARTHIARHGLQPQDVAGVAAAAGGPKGLAFLHLDTWLFSEWLAQAERPRLLAGASIGAWRMAAAVHPDGPAATRRLGEAYLECQRYRLKPPAHEVSQACAQVVDAMLGPVPAYLDAASRGHTLAVITARARGALAHHARKRDFIRPALANLVARHRLGAHLQRVVFEHPGGAGTPYSHSGAGLQALIEPADPFDTLHVPLHARNAAQALLASGSIPIVAQAVINPADAPSGQYWDGGLIDYHLLFNWSRLGGLVLYPHFAPYLTAGWLDKSLPWRRAAHRGAPAALSHMVLAVPSPELLARLPGGKLPDRHDFHVHGLDHDRRIRLWRQAMAECEAMVDDLAGFIRRPDPSRLEPLEA